MKKTKEKEQSNAAAFLGVIPLKNSIVCYNDNLIPQLAQDIVHIQFSS